MWIQQPLMVKLCQSSIVRLRYEVERTDYILSQHCKTFNEIVESPTYNTMLHSLMSI
jgi:hypothetical protein